MSKIIYKNKDLGIYFISETYTRDSDFYVLI